MSEARIDRISNENNTGGPTLSGITTFSGQNYFVPPKGTTAERPSDCPPGSIRFNTDSAHLEYFDGLQWLEFEAFNTELNGGARGVFAGQGASPVFSNVIDYVNISSAGNALDFGDLSAAKSGAYGCSSSTRGLFSGGYNPTRLNVIDYITISSTGDTQDFGDLIYARQSHTSCSNSTRGLFAGGFNPQTTPAATTYNAIDYTTIASTGNAQDFGDLSRLVISPAAVSSSTRGVFAGGTPLSNTIEFVTISTLGNSQDFGDLTYDRQITGNFTAFNPIRGIFGSNATPSSLDYITISTTGNSLNFGNLSLTRRDSSGASSSTRGVFGGGGELLPSAVQLNTIDYVTILTQGNAVDFGDLTTARARLASCSNAHGGL